MIKNEAIQLRDPFVFPEKNERKYYLYGSTDKNIWGAGTGFDVYIGDDLQHWEGPFPVFRPDKHFYAAENFWAPEVHEFQGRYYMFATFLRKDNRRRGTGVLVADSLLGPFLPHSDGLVTPKGWDCLDGTLFIDDDSLPWMVFCREWVQVGDGEICAVRLTKDLSGTAGEPELLFRASAAPWPTSFRHRTRGSGKNYVTDGPFIYRTVNGELLMLWASFVNNVYAQGVSRAEGGKITGPWLHDERPIYHDDGGHGMLFKTWNDELYLTLHSPNKTPLERPEFIRVKERDGKLAID